MNRSHLHSRTNSIITEHSLKYFRYKGWQLEGHIRTILQFEPLQATAKGSNTTTTAQCQSEHGNSNRWQQPSDNHDDLRHTEKWTTDTKLQCQH